MIELWCKHAVHQCSFSVPQSSSSPSTTSRANDSLHLHPFSSPSFLFVAFRFVRKLLPTAGVRQVEVHEIGRQISVEKAKSLDSTALHLQTSPRTFSSVSFPPAWDEWGRSCPSRHTSLISLPNTLYPHNLRSSVPPPPLLFLPSQPDIAEELGVLTAAGSFVKKHLKIDPW